MDIIKLAVHAVICFGFFIIFTANTSAALINPTQIASIFNYPPEKIKVIDKTADAQRERGNDIIAAYEIISEDQTFAPITIGIVKKGVLPIRKLEADVAQSEANGSPGRAMPKKIQLTDDAYGYTGLGGVGPGGSEEVIMATIPSKGIDILVKITFNRNKSLNFTPKTEAYYKLIDQGGEALTKKLIECVRLTITAASSLPASSLQASPAPQASPLSRTEDSTASSTPAISKPLPAKPERPVAKEEAASSLAWLYSLAAIILGGLGFVLYRYCKQ